MKQCEEKHVMDLSLPRTFTQTQAWVETNEAFVLENVDYHHLWYMLSKVNVYLNDRGSWEQPFPRKSNIIVLISEL